MWNLIFVWRNLLTIKEVISLICCKYSFKYFNIYYMHLTLNRNHNVQIQMVSIVKWPMLLQLGHLCKTFIFQFLVSAGKESWYSEYKRLSYEVPTVCTDILMVHSDQVLHVSCSHDGTMFATSSKDGFIKVKWLLSFFYFSSTVHICNMSFYLYL